MGGGRGVREVRVDKGHLVDYVIYRITIKSGSSMMKNRVLVITAVVLCLAAVLPGLHAQYGELTIVKINRPHDTETGGVGFKPNCTINNNSSVTVTGKVSCEITDLDAMEVVYEDAKSSVPFSGGNTDVAFSEFVPEGNKEYDAEFVVTGPQTGDDKNKHFTTAWPAWINPVYVISPDMYECCNFNPAASFLELAGAKSTDAILLCKIEQFEEGYPNLVYEDSVCYTFVAHDSVDIEFTRTELEQISYFNFITFWAEDDRGNVISDPPLRDTFYCIGIAEQPVVTSFGMRVDGSKVSFSLPEAGRAKVSVYDVTGNLVTVLSDETYSAGNHEIVWSRNRMVPGIYFVRLEAGEDKATCKVLKVD
jgi:hypothetical protein